MPDKSEKIKNTAAKLYRFSNSWTGTVVIVLLIIFFIAQAFVIPSGSMKSTMLIGDHLFVKKFSYGVPIPRIPWIEIPILPDFNGNGQLIEGERPQRGDIVIFRYPKDPRVHYVKRCVATGGDEVIFTPKNLYIRPSNGDDYIRNTYPVDQIVTLNGKLFVKDPYQTVHPGVHYESDPIAFNQMLLHLMHDNLPMQPAKVDNLPILDPRFPLNAFSYKVPEDQFFMMGDNRDHSNDSRFWGPVPYSLIVGKPWFVYFSWDDDYLIRWERIGMTMETLEHEAAKLEQEKEAGAAPSE